MPLSLLNKIVLRSTGPMACRNIDRVCTRQTRDYSPVQKKPTGPAPCTKLCRYLHERNRKTARCSMNEDDLSFFSFGWNRTQAVSDNCASRDSRRSRCCGTTSEAGWNTPLPPHTRPGCHRCRSSSTCRFWHTGGTPERMISYTRCLARSSARSEAVGPDAIIAKVNRARHVLPSSSKAMLFQDDGSNAGRRCPHRAKEHARALIAR